MNLVTIGRRRSRRGVAFLVVVALAFIAALVIVSSLASLDVPSIHVVIDGVDQGEAIDLGAIASQHQLLLVCIVTVAIVAAIIIVPIALLLALAAALIGVVVGLGVPLLMVVLFVAIVLWPLWLLALLLWWLWRSSSTPANIRA